MHENLNSPEPAAEQPMPAFSTDDGRQFYKSPESGGGGCVAVAWGEEGSVFVGDDKDPTQTPLFFTAHEWQVFVGAVRRGLFDEPPVA